MEGRNKILGIFQLVIVSLVFTLIFIVSQQ